MNQINPPVSFIASEIKSLCAKNKIRQIDIHRAAKINVSVLSLLMTGKQTVITDEQLRLIGSVIAKNPKERALLLRARMLDVCHGPGEELLDVVIHGKPVQREGFALKAPIADNARAALFYIAESAGQSQHIHDWVIGTAVMMGWKPPGNGKRAKRRLAPAAVSARTPP